MIRWCIHSLSLGLWPIQLPRRGSLGYVLLFLALSYLYRHTQKAFPFQGKVPRRGGGGTEAAFGTVLPGKAYGIPPTPHPARGGFLLR